MSGAQLGFEAARHALLSSCQASHAPSVSCLLQAKTRVHPTKLAGASVQDKLKLVRNDLTGARLE